MNSAPLPYGPQTPAIRQFLVRFAGLGRHDREQIVATYAAQQRTVEFQSAEDQLAIVMERSGRDDARAALTGPLLQLVKREAGTADGAASPESADAIDELDPVAEPALAAVLALLVRDLLTHEAFGALTAPVAVVLPFDER